MRHDKAPKILELARALARSVEGSPLDDMRRVASCGRSTADRMRNTVRDVSSVGGNSGPSDEALSHLEGARWDSFATRQPKG
jgi:hypothetical protein